MAKPDFYAPMPQDWTTFTAPTNNAISAQMRPCTVGYAKSGVAVYGGGTAGTCKLDVSSQSYSSGWCGFNIRVETAGSGDNVIFVLKGATTDLFRISAINFQEDWMIEYYNGATWTQIGSDITSPNLSTAQRLDINWVIADSGGTWHLYINGTSHSSFTGDTLTTSDTTVDEIRVEPVNPASTSNVYTCVGALVVDSADTRKLFQDESTVLSAGNSQQFTGTYQDIDEVWSAVATTNYNTVDADLEKADWNWIGMNAAITDSWTVESVRLGFVTKATTDPGWYFHGYARISGTDVDFGTPRQCPGANAWENANGWTYHGIDCDTDPTTSPLTAWANKSAVEAADFGIRAEDTA